MKNTSFRRKKQKFGNPLLQNWEKHRGPNNIGYQGSIAEDHNKSLCPNVQDRFLMSA